MPDYRVSFFKNLVNSDGHRFRCLQQEIDIRDSDSSMQAAESAARTFETQHDLSDWRLHADWMEVVAVERVEEPSVGIRRRAG